VVLLGISDLHRVGGELSLAGDCRAPPRAMPAGPQARLFNAEPGIRQDDVKTVAFCVLLDVPGRTGPSIVRLFLNKTKARPSASLQAYPC
jgi:hypothetical protein